MTCLVPLVLLAALAAGSEPTPALLVRQLGDPSYSVREAAEEALRRRGHAAEEALRAGLADSDPEVRRRCARLLPLVRRTALQARLDAFLSTGVDRAEPRLPGWARFREMVGDDLAARHLYVAVYRADPALLEALARDTTQVASQFATRQQKLQRSLTAPAVPGADGGSLAEVVGLFLAARCAAQAGRDDLNTFYQITNLLYQPRVRALVAGNIGAQRLLEPVLDRRLGDPGASSQAVYLARMLGMYAFMEQRLRPEVRKQLGTAATPPYDLSRLAQASQMAAQLDMHAEAARLLEPAVRKLAESLANNPNDTGRFYQLISTATILDMKEVMAEALRPAVLKVMADAAADRSSAGISRVHLAYSYASQLGMKEAIDSVLKPAVHQRVVEATRGPLDQGALHQAVNVARLLQLTETMERFVKPAVRRHVAALLEETDDPRRFSQAVSLARVAGLNDVLEDTLKPAARSLAAASLGKSSDLATIASTYDLLQSVGARDAVEEVVKPALRKALQSASDHSPTQSSTLQALRLAQSLRLKEAIPLALRMAAAPGSNTYSRGQAILYIADVGSKDDIPALEKLLPEKAAIGSMGFNLTTIHTQLGDVALAALVHLSGQALRDYGFPWFQAFAGQTLATSSPHAAGFADEAGRQAALKKWAEWRAAHKEARGE